MKVFFIARVGQNDFFDFIMAIFLHDLFDFFFFLHENLDLFDFYCNLINYKKSH
mgnify:CR=1 FL=1